MKGFARAPRTWRLLAPRASIPGHGDILEHDSLPERLDELVARRL
jgi:hypothetical protein